MKTVKNYRIDRVIENDKTYFILVRDSDEAILSSNIDIQVPIDYFEWIKEGGESLDEHFELSPFVRTIDNTVRTISFYKK